MEAENYSRAVRVNGEVIVLHCWACGTAHCVDPELCSPAELAHVVCSNCNCRMSMFLLNELRVENEIRPQITNVEPSASFAVLRFWK
jgi:hypothetical protein